MAKRKREWVRDNFTAGIDARVGTAASQDRFRDMLNVFVGSDRRIRARPPVRIPADSGLDPASKGLIGNDDNLYVFMPQAEAPASHETGANVETLYWDLPSDAIPDGDWELLDAFFFKHVAVALIRHETDSEVIPWITRLHVWDKQRPTYVEDPGFYPGFREFSHDPNDAAESGFQPLSADFMPRMLQAANHLWISGVKGDVSFSGVNRPRIWNALSQEDLLAYGLEYVFLIPKGSSVLELIIPWDFDELNADQKWVSLGVAFASGPVPGVQAGSWSPMKPGISASFPTTYIAERVASRFGGGAYETKVTVGQYASKDYVVRILVTPAGHRFSQVSAPTLAVESVFHAGTAHSKNAAPGWPISATAFELTKDGGLISINGSGPGSGQEFTLMPQPSTDTDRVWMGGPGDYYGLPSYQWIEGQPTIPHCGDRFFVFGRKTILVPKGEAFAMQQIPAYPPGTYAVYNDPSYPGQTIIYDASSRFATGDVVVKGTLGDPAAVYFMVYQQAVLSKYVVKIISDSGSDWIDADGDYTATLNGAYILTWLKRPTTFTDYLFAYEVGPPELSWYQNIKDQFLLLSGEDEAGLLPASNVDQGGSKQVRVLAGVHGRLMLGYAGSCQLWSVGADPTAHAQIDVRSGIGIGDHDDFPMASELTPGSIMVPGSHGIQALNLTGYQVNLLGNERIGGPVYDLGSLNIMGIYPWPSREEWIIAAESDGEFMLLVLDLHPDVKVVAWQTWTSEILTGLAPSSMVALGDRLWFRVGEVQGYFDGGRAVADFQDDGVAAMHSFQVRWQPDHLGYPNRQKHLLEAAVAVEGVCRVSVWTTYRNTEEESAAFYPPQVATFQELHPLETVGQTFALQIASTDSKGFALHGISLVFTLES